MENVKEKKEMNKNVFIVMGLSAINSNWNADWDGIPKEDANGDFIASPNDFEYLIRQATKKKIKKCPKFYFTWGFNKYKDTKRIIDNNKKENEEQQFLLDEAHFLYSSSIFNNYDEFQGYTEEDYKIFKDASLLAVSHYNSKAKCGCKNEFAMFIETKEEYNYLIDLSGLDDYIEVYKEDEKVIYDLTVLSSILIDLKDKIDKVEVYYNYRKIAIKGLEDLDIIKKYDLISRKEI